MATSVTKCSEGKNSSPNQFQLALALAVVKSKPANVSVRDYIAKLRKQIIPGTREQKYASHQQYLDAAGLWQERCKDAQAEIAELRLQNLSLEKKCDELIHAERNQELQGDVDGRLQAVPSTPAKRTIDHVSETPSTGGRPTKRVRKEPTLAAVSSMNEGADHFGYTEAGSTTAFHLHAAHKMFKKLEPDPESIAYHLGEAASNLAEHISSIARALQHQQLNASLTRDKQLRDRLSVDSIARADVEMDCTIRACSRSFTSLLYGLQALWAQSTESARREHGAVTQAYLQSLNALLTTITSTCKLIVRQRAGPATMTTGSKARLAKASRSKRVDTQIPEALARFIRTILSELIPSQGGCHSALFEGILYFLLERTGKCLYMLTFNHERSATNQENIEKILAPVNDALDCPTVIEASAVRIEAKLLVGILSQAMKLAPHFLGGTCPTISTQKPSRSATSSGRVVKISQQPKTSLTVAARERLQATLIHCMFGDEIKDVFEETDDTEDEEENEVSRGFIQRLRKPVPPIVGTVGRPPKIEESDVPQWFREEIWRLVGWEILGRAGEW